MKKKIFLTFLSFVLVLSLAACSKAPSSAPESSKEPEQTSQAEEPKVEEKEAVDFVKLAEGYFISEEEALKAYGLEKKGLSVIALSWPDNIYLVDAGANIAALPDNHHIPEDILEKYPSFTDHDGNIDYEKLEELDFDVIIASQGAIEKDEALKEIVDKKAIKVLQIPQSKTYDEVLKNIAVLSTAFGDENVAKENIAAYLERVEEAKALGEGCEKRNVAVIMVTADGEFILSAGSFADSLIAKLELNNVAAGMKLEGEADQFGFYASPGMDKLAEAKTDALVLMVRMKGDPKAREAACEELINSIKETFGEDSDLVKNEKYEIVDHHGIIAVSPVTISGIENIASIVFE